MTELELYTQARIGGNNPAETTGQFVAAKFEHDTARPVDGYAAPQLHTHAVIFNVTERGDGQTRALQERGLFDSQQFATAVYQSELTWRLSQLGYQIEPGRSGAPEIKGYTQEYLDASSQRSQQIRDRMQQSGFHGHEAAEIAAHSTRDKKLIQSPAEVLAAHRQLAAEFGNQADRIVGEARARSQGQTAEHVPETMQRVAREAVTFARQRSFEREAVADERDILRDALRRGMSETTYSEVRASFEARLASGEFQRVPGQKHDTGRSFTTAETIRAEKEVLRRMQQGQGRAEPMMNIQDAVKHTGKYEILNTAQRRAAEEILTSRDAVQGLQGFAGVGKTASLQTIREAVEKRGFIVEGFAPTSRAAHQLRDAGISADTLQGFLSRSQQPTPDRHLYMVDESSLASTQQVRDFLAKLDSGDRVLFIGDVRQHQGVEAGKPFEQLVQAGMKTAQLDQIVRQKDPELLRAVEHLSRGEVAEGIALLEQQGRVTEITDPRKRIAAMARSYAASPDKTLIVSPDNASRREINQAVRSELQALGILQPENHALRVLAPRSDMTGADRTWAARYGAGDVLRYQRGSNDIGIEKQSYARVSLPVQLEIMQGPLIQELESTGIPIWHDINTLPGMRQPKDKFAASALVLATQAFITNNAQITASTEAENFLNESQQYLDNVGDIKDVARTINRITTELHPEVMRVYADDPNRRFILSGGTFLLGLSAACGYIRNRNKMKTLDVALDRLLKELKKPSEDPWNLTSYQEALAMITSSRGKATRRLVYDTFLRFFAGATAELEWLDTAAQITGVTS